MIGDVYTYLLLGSGPLLVIAALVLVKVMYGRVKLDVYKRQLHPRPDEAAYFF